MHWAEINEKGSLLGMRLVLWIQKWLGPWPLRITLWLVISWYFVFHRSARHASKSYLLCVEPTLHVRYGVLLLRSYRHLLSFGEAMLDKVAAWSGQVDERRLCGEGRDRFRLAIRRGCGGVVLVSHHGNLDIINALTETHPGLELVILMHTKNADKFNRLIEQASQRRRPRIIETTEISPATAQMLSQVLSNGGFVVIAADRVPLNSTRFQWVEFLGEQAPFPYGPFLLAALLRCPVYLAACVKQGQQFRIDFDQLSDSTDLRRCDRDQWIVDTTQCYVKQLAEQVRQAPLQWFNFYFFWSPPVLNEVGHD